MKLISILVLSLLMLTSCGVKEVVPVQPKTESNTVDIGNKAIITITGSDVQPIR